MNIGRAVRRRAAELGLSQAELCLTTGISNAYMSMLMNSKIADPRISRVIQVAEVLDLTIDELVQRAEAESSVTSRVRKSEGGGVSQVNILQARAGRRRPHLR
ncbi:helix-turn-helix transcriptional regulator [Eggerthellaceae bacterium zg-1084]|uniref:helix-turn-helix domain-containing protein n=1 Tax=Berryella wangjianweii TaxID=2734634 RepID=UPI001557B40E|nr:helix-turn-helix transcriptional regulator [Berryella wangjianweii]NPD31506.1 helix-turn-helix transcriptional regulator [Berryella wangjianweii]NPD32999.1 helix-turn-helix transcriptional regulator [Eggerthellaceae bacterium zg-997]